MFENLIYVLSHVWPNFVLALYYLFNAAHCFHYIYTWHWQYIQCLIMNYPLRYAHLPESNLRRVDKKNVTSIFHSWYQQVD